MAASDAYKSGMRGNEKPRRGQLRVLRIELGDGGATVTHEHDDAKGKNGLIWGSGQVPEKKVFGEMDDLLAHVKKHAAEAFAK